MARRSVSAADEFALDLPISMSVFPSAHLSRFAPLQILQLRRGIDGDKKAGNFQEKKAKVEALINKKASQLVAATIQGTLAHTEWVRVTVEDYCPAQLAVKEGKARREALLKECQKSLESVNEAKKELARRPRAPRRAPSSLQASLFSRRGCPLPSADSLSRKTHPVHCGFTPPSLLPSPITLPMGAEKAAGHRVGGKSTLPGPQGALKHAHAPKPLSTHRSPTVAAQTPLARLPTFAAHLCWLYCCDKSTSQSSVNSPSVAPLPRALSRLQGKAEKVGKLTASEEALRSGNPDKYPEDPDELRAAIEEKRAEIAAIFCADPTVLQQYQERAKRVDELRKKVKESESALAKVHSDIALRLAAWLPKLRALITDIAEKFNDAFKIIGSVGTVSLFEPEDGDFGKYEARILVRFRDGEQMCQLTANRQSGGERSVSTMFFLICLQDLTKCPFRMVDEINQARTRALQMRSGSSNQGRGTRDSSRVPLAAFRFAFRPICKAAALTLPSPPFRPSTPPIRAWTRRTSASCSRRWSAPRPRRTRRSASLSRPSCSRSSTTGSSPRCTPSSTCDTSKLRFRCYTPRSWERGPALFGSEVVGGFWGE